MEEKIIHSLDELLAYGAEVLRTQEIAPIKLDGEFLLAVHVTGPSWDHRIDRRSAQYVVALQKAFDDLLDEFAPNTDHADVLIKVLCQDGSFEGLADIKEALTKAVEKMQGWQTFVCLLVAVGGISGYFWLDRYYTHEEDMAKMAHEKEQNKAMFQPISQLYEQAKQDSARYTQYERPIRILIKALNDEDTIEIGEKGMKMNAQIARKYSPPRAPRSESQISYADGEYIVNSRRYDEGEVVLELEQHGVKIKGYLWQLDDADREAFIASLDKHEREDNLPFYMKLQLNVEHTQRTLKHAVILGEGAPREGKKCFKLNEILQK